MNKRGFSLIELMLIIGAIAGIALVVMQISKNSARTQADAFSLSDYFTLKSEVDNFFSNDFDCTASLKDLTFKGSTIKDTPLEVELFHGDQLQAKTRKFLSSTDATTKRYGKLDISSVNLSMPDYSGNANFPQGNNESFKAEIKIEGEKNKMGKSTSFQAIKKTIRLNFDTASNGESKITSCIVNASGGASGFGNGQFWQNESGSRNLDTEYSNTTGKPIMVSVSLGPNSSAGQAELTIYVNNMIVAHAQGEWTNSNGYLTASTIVAAGDSYKVSSGGKLPIQYWMELR